MTDLLNTAENVAFDRVEVRSNLFPAVSINLRSTPGAPPSALMGIMQPTITLSGAAGSKVIAPNGEASQTLGWVSLFGFLAVVTGGSFAFGRWTKS